MRKINLLLIALLVIVTSALTSCKKENRIEKNLWNNGGKWNIERAVQNDISTNPADNLNLSALNFGSFTFKKDGTGNYVFTVDENVEIGTFSYSNTEDRLTWIRDNEPLVFDLDWKKDDLQISYTENYKSNGEVITSTVTFYLKKI